MWDDPGKLYDYHVDIFVKGGSVPLANFPVPVRISEARIGGFKYKQADSKGQQLVFIDTDGNILPYEVDTWDTAGESLVWVGLATLPTTGMKITMFWGLGDGKEPFEYTPKAVWDANFVGIWHMNASGATGKTIADTTGRNNGTLSGSATTAAGKLGSAASYDFSLERSATGKAKCGCRFVHITDSEISEVNDVNRQWIADVKRLAVNEQCAFIVHTGDICYLKGMQAHAELMNTSNMGLPVLYCLGNHDCVAGDYGEQAFEELFGPCRYSFNAGGIHFLVVPMTEGWDVRPSYTEDELADWLRADLALIDRRQPVMVFSHMIFHAKNESEAGLVIGKERPLDLRSACNFKGFVYGHVHNTYTSGNGGVTFMASSNANFGGIDHSPEVLRVFDVKPDGSFVAENHYGRNPSRTWQTSRAGAVWERKLPAPVLFCTPVVSCGKVFVGTTDDENRSTGMVVAFDAKSGAIVWKRKVANSIKNRMVIAGGNVIAQDAGGGVYAFAANSGKSVWKMQLPYHFQVLASAVTASEDGRTAYVGYGKRLTAVDAATGAVKWRNSAWESEPVAGGPGIGEGKMVWSSNWDGLECHALATGARLWRLDGKPWRFPGADPLITGGKAVVACYWHIGEVDLATGQALRVKELKEVTALPSSSPSTARRLRSSGTARQTCRFWPSARTGGAGGW